MHASTQPVDSIVTDPFYYDEYELVKENENSNDESYYFDPNKQIIDELNDDSLNEKELKEMLFNIFSNHFDSQKSKRGAYKMFDKDRLHSLIDDMSSYG